MATVETPQTENEELIARIAEEVWNQGNLDVLDEVMTDEYVAHLPGIDPVHGPEEYKEQVQRYHAAFPDFHVEITNLFSDDDHVVAQYEMTGTNDGALEGGPTDIPATGNSVEIDGIVVTHFEDGTPVEEYNRSDSLTMLAQLGLLD